MPDDSEKPMIITTQIRISSPMKDLFVDWQAKLHALIATFPGFVSLEILSPTETSQDTWIIVQRFSNSAWLSNWRQSEERKFLIEGLKKLLNDDNPTSIQDMDPAKFHFQGGVTEVFVTQVAPGKENAYREWIAKIHQAEAKFPGFRGVYVQSPSQGQGLNWITLLQFDHPNHLDKWLLSPERAQILQESAPLISSLESHRVISPYAGWFASIATKDGEIPPVWKQTMIVLLVLFPIVMLELKYLPFLTAQFNPALSTFISNAISVTLLAWPMVPIAIKFLSWWLSPKGSKRGQATVLGTGLVLLLYLIEIMIFWNLLY